MGKGNEEDGNAYATSSDWTMQEEVGVAQISWRCERADVSAILIALPQTPRAAICV